VHFLAACSNIQKVIESLQSRLHIIKILPPSDTKIETTAKLIVKNEGIKIDDSALAFIIGKSDHSIRNVINNLEKIAIYQDDIHIDTEICDHLCSTISFQRFDKYTESLKSKNLAEAIDIINNIYDYGYSVIDILNYFFIYIKTSRLIDEETKYKIIPFLCEYITIFYNTHEHSIELALFTNDIYQLFL
jgi:DNA polymerase III gamma/tau subunit